MSWAAILSELERKRLQLDSENEKLCSTTDAGYQIFCAKGCCNCCSLAVHCSFPEALTIAGSLSAEQRENLTNKLPVLRQISQQAENLKQFLRQFRQQFGGCPFLRAETGCCGIYPLRPYSCRALLSTRNSSWCAVDFADLHPQEKEAFLSSLDPELTAFPTHYLATSQELGLELEAAALEVMRAAFGVTLSGNLIYMVWLELEYQLSEVLVEGVKASRSFLEDKGLDLPFLLQLQGHE